MSSIYLYKMQTENMKASKLAEIGIHLGMKGEITETEEALAMHDPEHALAFAQPRGRFAGLLFYVDQTRGQAEPVDKPVDVKIAEGWAADFLDKFNLRPKKVKGGKVQLSFELSAYRDQAISYDGKARRSVNLKTEIGSKTEINGIPVLGPRATFRMAFKDQTRPVSIHRGLWENIDVFGEKELVREHDIYTVVKERLNRRRDCSVNYDVADCRLAYFTREYCGGPDVLEPFYFVEIEFESINREIQEKGQGPTQMIMVPAYR
jgi:hypothetical protein